MTSTSGSLKIMRRKLKRTPEAIVVSVEALDIGRAMLKFIRSDSREFQSSEQALEILQKWIEGSASVAECRASAFNVHEMARQCSDSREQNALRSIGHAVATAHVSSHLKACKEYSVKVLP